MTTWQDVYHTHCKHSQTGALVEQDCQHDQDTETGTIIIKSFLQVLNEK